MSSKANHLRSWYYEGLAPKACAGLSVGILLYILGSGFLWS